MFIENIIEAPGFEHSDLLRQHHVAALVNVPIKTDDFTFGVLEADSNAPRQFSEDDRNFLTGFANLLAAAVQRQRADAERERLIHELAEAKLAAQGEAMSKSRLLAVTGHDLKQSLQAIVICLDRLARRMADPGDKQDVSRALRAADTLAQGLDYLLTVAQIESGAFEPRISTIDLGRLLKDLAEQYQPIAQDKGLSLRCVRTRAQIQSDRQLLVHIIQNLMSNAIKYTQKGRILVGCRRRDAAVAIEVHDTGIGIPDDELEGIFEEYRRLDMTRRDGVGLGLAIVKRMAELVGHRLAVRSRLGKGTCFSVEVPITLKDQ